MYQDEFFIEYIPQVSSRRKPSGRYLSTNRGHLPPLDPTTGLLLIHGNGCSKFKNCFECSLPDCKYNESAERKKHV